MAYRPRHRCDIPEGKAGSPSVEIHEATLVNECWPVSSGAHIALSCCIRGWFGEERSLISSRISRATGRNDSDVETSTTSGEPKATSTTRRYVPSGTGS